MQRLEQMAMAPLGLVDKFQQELKAILDERTLPASDMISRINYLREQIQQECREQCDAFDEEAQEVEKDLFQKLEQLREIRERAAVVRGALSAMFRSG